MHKLLLPRLGQTMEEAVVAAWLVEPGDEFEVGTTLYEVETEKVTTGVEATVAGRLVRVLAAVDDRVEVGAVVAVVAEPGEAVTDEDIDRFLAAGEVGLPGSSVVATNAPAPVAAPDAPGASATVRAMPRTRARARQAGVDIGSLVGTGVDGLVTEPDVEAAVARVSAHEHSVSTPAPAGATAVTLAEPLGVPGPGSASASTGTRGIRIAERRRQSRVARRMAEVTARSWAQIPQFSQSVTVDASRWRSRRTALRESTGIDIGYTDMVLASVVRAIREVPDVNSILDGDELVIYSDINVSVAVDTPYGLQVPVLHSLQDLTLGGIARALRDITVRAREDRLTYDDIQGGTITVSNLGMYGIESGFPLVTSPQTCIIFVGALSERVVALGDGFGVRPMCNVVTAFDHRAIDGATAARFTSSLRRHMQEV